MLTIFLFLVGFFILIKGANLMIDGAVSIARKLDISNWVIGVTIVGVGTSIPEFSVMLSSALKGSIDVGLGTIIGSNTFNLLFILGLCAIIFPLSVKREWIKKEFSVNILAIVVAVCFAIFAVFGGEPGISRSEAAVLLFLFVAWVVYVVARKKKEGADPSSGPDTRIYALHISFLLILAGIIGVGLGARWVVSGAEFIARSFGVSDALIGLTIVGIGTSLPELSVSTVAAFRRNSAISVGNIVGSNVFDFLGILGFVGLFGRVDFNPSLIPDIFMTIAAALILLGSVYVGRKYIIGKKKGSVFIIFYIAYVVSIILRG